MRQPLQLRRVLLVVVAALTLALAFGQGSARAATPTGGTISAGSPTVTWQGEFYAATAVPDPLLCPPGTVDTIDLICDHFALTVATAGSVGVTINWPSNVDDFDLYVYDSTNMEVASSADVGTTSESVTFTATAGTTYEVRVIPFNVVASAYNGVATLTSTGGGAGGQGGGIDPPVSISNARITEGDAGTKNAVFTLTMPHSTISPVTVNYVTADPTVDRTFTATAGTDYLAQTGTAVFAPNTTRTTISIPLLGDLTPEQNETFVVRLLLPSPPGVVAKIEDPQGIGTIVNEDWGRTLSGSGKVGNALTGEGSLSLRAVEWGSWGKLSFRQGAVNFYSNRFTSIAFNDVTHSATIQGTGWNAGHSVTYTLQIADNGVGTLDGFALTLSDGSRGSGPLTVGDISYRG
jgi:hypothetical protein